MRPSLAVVRFNRLTDQHANAVHRRQTFDIADVAAVLMYLNPQVRMGAKP